MRIVIPNSRDREEKYIDKFKEVLTDDWIKQQVKNMYYQSKFKEAGAFLDLIHPILRHYVDIWASARKASALGHDYVIMGVGDQELVSLGQNLYELDGLYDVKNYRSRLQDKELFEDTCWELEVAHALKCANFDVHFEDDTINRFDITAGKGSISVAIECKNKQIEDEAFIANRAFTYYLGSKLVDKLNKGNYELDIKIAIRGTARIEDAKKVSISINEMLKKGEKNAQVGEIYKIEVIEIFKHVATPHVIQLFPRINCCITGKERLESEIHKIYTEPPSFSDHKNRIFFSYPEEKSELKNISDLLKKANKQIGNQYGCVFLQAPHHEYNQAFAQVKTAMKRNSYSNIHLVKVIAIKRRFHEGSGVRTDRKEEYVINNSARNKIPSNLLNDLCAGLMFGKYKELMNEGIKV